MISWKPVLACGAILALAACQGQEATRLCAATGDPSVGLTAAAHDATGRLVLLQSDATAMQTRITTRSLDSAIVGDLWQDADHTFQATLRGEISPCDGEDISFMTVAFVDGEIQTRETRCAGNAMAQLTDRSIATSQEEDRPGTAPEDSTLPDIPDSAAMACEWANERL